MLANLHGAGTDDAGMHLPLGQGLLGRFERDNELLAPPFNPIRPLLYSFFQCV